MSIFLPAHRLLKIISIFRIYNLKELKELFSFTEITYFLKQNLQVHQYQCEATGREIPRNIYSKPIQNHSYLYTNGHNVLEVQNITYSEVN